MNDLNLENKQTRMTIWFLSLYFIIYSIFEFPYVYDMYSCERLNFCGFDEFELTHFQIIFFQIIKIFSSALILIPRFRKVAIFSVLAINIIFMFSNRLLHSPEQAYLNFLLLTFLFMKLQDQESIDILGSYYYNLRVRRIYIFIFYLAYSYSGFTKFRSEVWINGSFMDTFLSQNHLVYNTYFLDRLSTNFKMHLTYFTVFIEMFSFLSLTNRLLAIFFWTNLTLIQLGLVFWVDLWQVSFGMLICHFFCIDFGNQTKKIEGL